MGRKIFVSYKYADDDVENLSIWDNSTVRNYVDEFESLLDESDHIYKGESEGEDLSSLSEDTIWQKLRNRIYDSSITILFISPGMRENWKKDREQWIPWEVSYSLKETSRKNKNGDAITSKTNAMIAVILPDASGSYSYFLEERACCASGCTAYKTGSLFQIISDNMFNLKNDNSVDCEAGRKVWYGECSYIAPVKWNIFKANYNKYMDAAYERQERIEDYDIIKSIK